MAHPTKNLVDITEEILSKASALEQAGKNAKWSECNKIAAMMGEDLLKMGKFLLGFEPELGKSLVVSIKDALSRLELDYEETLSKISDIDETQGKVLTEPAKRRHQ